MVLWLLIAHKDAVIHVTNILNNISCTPGHCTSMAKYTISDYLYGTKHSFYAKQLYMTFPFLLLFWPGMLKKDLVIWFLTHVKGKMNSNKIFVCVLILFFVMSVTCIMFTTRESNFFY
jgi:hypothetical protein